MPQTTGIDRCDSFCWGFVYQRQQEEPYCEQPIVSHLADFISLKEHRGISFKVNGLVGRTDKSRTLYGVTKKKSR